MPSFSFFVKASISVLLIMAALAVIGAAMLPMLNIQYTPSAAERRIDLYFSWPDASARLIEQSATSRIEGAMSTVAGCENVSSRSAKGYGNISVAFRKGTDMEAARFEVASAIRNLYAKLPQEISYPYISLAASGSRESETLVYTIKADLPSERIEEYVTAHVSTPLSQVEGVGGSCCRVSPPSNGSSRSTPRQWRPPGSRPRISPWHSGIISAATWSG